MIYLYLYIISFSSESTLKIKKKQVECDMMAHERHGSHLSQ